MEIERVKIEPNTGRITIREICERLQIGERAVYALLHSGEIPSIRLPGRFLVTRHAFEQWERNCGMGKAS